MGKQKSFALTTTFILAIFIYFGHTTQAAAAALATGSATVYKVSMSKFEIDNGTGSTSVTAFDSSVGGVSAILDIASAADTNTSVGNFMSGLIVSDGSYSRVKPTPSGTFTIAGSISYLGTTYYTTGAIGSGGGAATNTVGPAQECTISITMGAISWENMPGTITVTNGTPNYNVRVKFDTSHGIGLYNGPGGSKEIYPEQPSVTMSLTSA